MSDPITEGDKVLQLRDINKNLKKIGDALDKQNALLERQIDVLENIGMRMP